MYVKQVMNAEITLASGGIHNFPASEGDLLQSLWAFLTTESDLATIQAFNALSIDEWRIMEDKKQETAFTIWDANQGMDDAGTATAGQYSHLDFDPMFQGIGHALGINPSINLLAGTAGDAIRAYVELLQLR